MHSLPWVLDTVETLPCGQSSLVCGAERGGKEWVEPEAAALRVMLPSGMAGFLIGNVTARSARTPGGSYSPSSCGSFGRARGPYANGLSSCGCSGVHTDLGTSRSLRGETTSQFHRCPRWNGSKDSTLTCEIS